MSELAFWQITIGDLTLNNGVLEASPYSKDMHDGSQWGLRGFSLLELSYVVDE